MATVDATESKRFEKGGDTKLQNVSGKNWLSFLDASSDDVGKSMKKFKAHTAKEIFLSLPSSTWECIHQSQHKLKYEFPSKTWELERARAGARYNPIKNDNLQENFSPRSQVPLGSVYTNHNTN